MTLQDRILIIDILNSVIEDLKRKENIKYMKEVIKTKKNLIKFFKNY